MEHNVTFKHQAMQCCDVCFFVGDGNLVRDMFGFFLKISIQIVERTKKIIVRMFVTNARIINFTEVKENSRIWLWF